MAPAADAVITYVFHLSQGRKERITLSFDPDSFLLRLPPAASAEPWTRLDFHPCGHCPLTAGTAPHCPLALALSAFIPAFDTFYSYDVAVVEVIRSQRTVVAQCPLQDAMASIIGLVGATSGCPYLAFLRPMARFHLPFASEEETMVRAFSLHLLQEYLQRGGSGEATVSVEGLEAKYRAVAEVNRCMADRIRAAFDRDAVVNAIVILDTFAQAIPFVAHKALKELRPLFAVTP